MFLQDSKLFRVCQVRNEDIDMSYVAIYIIYTIYIVSIYTLNNKIRYVSYIYLKQLSTL